MSGDPQTRIPQNYPPRAMILLDFVKGETRRITQEDAARRMAAQRARGVRMTREGVSPPPPSAPGRA